MKYILIGFIKAWRAIVSPWYGEVCRYYPSCSAYGLEAVQLHGAIKGTWLIVRRLLRCNPWSRGGVDPVPGSPLEATIAAEEAEEAAEAVKAARRSEAPNEVATSASDMSEVAVP